MGSIFASRRSSTERPAPARLAPEDRMAQRRAAVPAVLVTLALGGAMNANAATRIERRPWGKTAKGEAVELFTLTRAGSPTVSITNFGGFIVSIAAPDRAGA